MAMNCLVMKPCLMIIQFIPILTILRARPPRSFPDIHTDTDILQIIVGARQDLVSKDR